ncbi:acyl-CoA/acyl-ACP dehydrogenase [Acetobacteraceae bacterium KSS8]|uniref:Acyl-CoA/acyl-ACP dehydrogenase n=1 Tax=Endosaccharibacter trunci TaxID=2812733 RepID=A0ABT1W829_9PROT|nr:acyl-CoA/acyl-ACP dehydrogenase [Acetobacteraceae bacterium KSS8]
MPTPPGDLLPTLDDLPFFAAQAAKIDQEGGLPVAAVERLREAGLFRAPLPVGLGGSGLGTEPAGALAALSVLRALGRADLSLGRLFEGHLNVIRLVVLHGDADQNRALARTVREGGLTALWVTDETPVRARPDGEGWVLDGEKSIASGVGLASAALITVQPPDGQTRLALAPVERSGLAARVSLSGMRGAATGRYDFTGARIAGSALIGAPGIYLSQPEFSAGAWRGAAVALGGIDRLVDEMRTILRARGRDADPHQRVRIGEALIQRETAAFWCRRACLLAEGRGYEPGDVQATVNLARIACETSALAVIERVQRGLGLGAFVRGGVVERTMRDLATYLRQPAPDETLVEAAGWFVGRDMPDPDRMPAGGPS